MSRRDRWPSCPATDAERLAPSVESENSRDDPPEAAEQDETQVFGGARLRPREKPSEDACDKDRDVWHLRLYSKVLYCNWHLKEEMM